MERRYVSQSAVAIRTAVRAKSVTPRATVKTLKWVGALVTLVWARCVLLHLSAFQVFSLMAIVVCKGASSVDLAGRVVSSRVRAFV